MKRVACFGTGKVYQVFIRVFNERMLEIVGAIDNDTEKQGEMLNGHNVYAPHEIKELNVDFIIITTSYVSEVKAQLLSLGIEEKRILDFFSIYKRLLPLENEMWNEMLREDAFFNLLMQNNEEESMWRLEEMQRKTLFLEAKNFINSLPKDRIDSLEEVEFQVYSQWGEDGIIQWLIKNVEIPNKIFVEFGVEDYQEANTRFLLMNNNWSGLVIDGSKDNMDRLRNERWVWRYDLRAVNKFITKDNINEIIKNAGFEGDIGILSVDIDGNDYWVLDAIDCVQPRILICEYNSLFGDKEKVTIPYDDKFIRTNSHYSNIYYGASLAAFQDYAEKHGYYYVGSNSAGINAFFVRKDSISETLIPRNSKRFIKRKFREIRNMDGELSFLGEKEQLEKIKDMLLVDLTGGEVKKISELYKDTL